ncbi:MAG: GNAT family N-acetyltransferase [Chloroflexota bacterium]|nr:GNAT family N-acetyltransferase [Chloroflexota bacterium]
MGNAFRIEKLADHPSLIPSVASEVWREWGYGSPDGCIADLRQTRRDDLPICEVAIRESAPVGVVSLIACNLPPRCDLSPWLAGLYVWPAYRRQGIGAELVRTLEADAVRLRHPVLYLYTESAEEFYRRLGWQTFDRDRWEGEEIALMTRVPGAEREPAARGVRGVNVIASVDASAPHWSDLPAP